MELHVRSTFSLTILSDFPNATELLNSSSMASRETHSERGRSFPVPLSLVSFHLPSLSIIRWHLETSLLARDDRAGRTILSDYLSLCLDVSLSTVRD